MTPSAHALAAARLRAAADAYLRATGRSVPPSRLDPAREPVRSLYRRFVRGAPARLRPAGLGANSAQWLALELGLKPAVREVLAPHRLPALEDRARAAGWHLEVLDVPLREGQQHGWVRPDGVPNPTNTDVRLIAYCGPDPAVLRRLRDLDAFLIHLPPDPAAERPAILEMGALLGYPACCTEAFADRDATLDNRAYAALALARTARPHALLNTLTLGAFHFLPWFPCRFDCPVSLPWARALDAHLASNRPVPRAAALRALALPRLFVDDRRQVILDGAPAPDGSITYRAAYGPYAFDRSSSSALFDWAFQVDVASRFAHADTLARTADGFELRREGRPVDPLPDLGDALLFTFTHDG